MADYPATGHLLAYSKDRDALTPIIPEQISFTQAENFAPRITSSKGETDLDGTLHHTFPVDHGFSKVMSDDNQNYRVVGDYNPVDGTLYPSRVPTTISTGSVYTGTSFSYTAKATNYKRTYVANRINGVNAIWRVFDDGTFAAVAGLPAAVTGSTCKITSMVFHKDYLYFTGKESSTVTMKLYRYDFNAGTTVEICSDSFSHLVSLRNILYATYLGGVIWSITNETTTTATATRVKEIGPSWDGTEAVFSVVEFNGAIWVAKYSGLYRFDGVDAVKIIHHYPKFLTNHQGALYYLNNGWLYRFNGSLVEKVQYFGDAEAVTDLQSHLENLYILTIPNVTTYKYSGTSSDGTIDYRIFEYDGVNFRVFSEADTTGAPPTMLSSVGLLLLALCPSNVSFACTIFNFDFSLRYTSVTNTAQRAYVITADFDGDLPNIHKMVHRIQVDTDNPSATDSCSITYQVYKNGYWASWATSQTLSNLSGSVYGMNALLLPGPAASQYNSFERIRIKVTLNPIVGSTISLKSITIHYTNHPKFRRRLSFSVNVTGNHNPTSSSEYLNDSTSYQSPFNSKIAYQHLLHILEAGNYNGSYILGPEYWRLDEAITASDTTIYLKGYIWDNPFTSGGYNFLPVYAIVDTSGNIELIRATSTSNDLPNTRGVINAIRGAYRFTASSFDVGSYIYPVFIVSNGRLISDTITPNEIFIDENGESQVARRVQLELTEL